MDDIILKRFEKPDEVRTFEKGKFEVINLGGMTIGRATYEPGWKWSVDVSPLSGTDFTCPCTFRVQTNTQTRSESSVPLIFQEGRC